MSFNVRKYSYLNKDSPEWQHFHTRNDIILCLTKLNNEDTLLKLIWTKHKTVLEDLLIFHYNQNVSVFAKFPSIGFKSLEKRFQITINLLSEFESIISTFTTLGVYVKIQQTYNQSVHSNQYSQSNNEHEFASQSYDSYQTNRPRYETGQIIRSASRTSFRTPGNCFIDQPEYLITKNSMERYNPPNELVESNKQHTPVLQPPTPNTSTERFPLLSQIIGKKRKRSDTRLQDLNEQDIIKLLKKKLNDPEFIEFVEKVEVAIGMLQEEEEE